MPPPYSSNWTLTIHDDHTADFVYNASHVEEPPLYEASGIEISPEQLAEFCDNASEMRAQTDGAAGGPYAFWNLTFSDATTNEGATTNPDDWGPTWAVAQQIVGEERLAEAEAAFDAWAADYDK